LLHFYQKTFVKLGEYGCGNGFSEILTFEIAFV
jgi:hypothetical protein